MKLYNNMFFRLLKAMKITPGCLLIVFVNKLGNVFGIDPVVGGIGAVLSGGGAFMCKKIFCFACYCMLFVIFVCIPFHSSYRLFYLLQF